MANPNDPNSIDRDQVKAMSDQAKADLNADPITGEPGSHPIGTGVGAAGGAAAGAAIGSIVGPLGTLIGGAIGAVVGGLAGHSAGEAIDPTLEEAYWREAHSSTPYFNGDQASYDRDYSSAYKVGYESRPSYAAGTRFEDVEADLRTKWEATKGESRITWEAARNATQDAWNRTTGTMTGQPVTSTTHTISETLVSHPAGSDAVNTGAMGSVDEKAHPIATGAGALGGAAAGAGIGTALAGPIGTVVGGVIGAIAGGSAGHNVGEAINPTEDAYWRGNYNTASYYNPNYNYDTDYRSAYSYGYAARNKYAGRTWDDSLENDLARDWDSAKGTSRLAWDDARNATRDAWNRTSNSVTGQPVYNDGAVEKSHPVATGAGALGGAAAGAGIGTAVAGPIGTVVGGVIGAIAGGSAGHNVGEAINPTEDAYWRGNYNTASYYNPSYNYDTDYRSAYSYGYAARNKYAGRTWDDSLENDLARDWETSRGTSRLTWTDARNATRDAWNRTANSVSGQPVYNDGLVEKSHPIATGAGALGGAAAGAGIGTALAGPIGTVVGGVIGAIAGGSAGHNVGEAINPTEDAYWRSNYNTTPYYNSSYDYDTDYRSAYSYGYAARNKYAGRTWDDSLENDLARDWETSRGTSRLTWTDARHAARAAYSRQV